MSVHGRMIHTINILIGFHNCIIYLMLFLDEIKKEVKFFSRKIRRAKTFFGKK